MAKLGWVDAPMLKKYRKWAFLGSFIFAALLTPTPDPFNQILMAFPMYAFYEVGIVSAGFFNKPSPEKAGISDDASSGPPGPPAGGNGKEQGRTTHTVSDSENEYLSVPGGKK